MTLLKWGQEEEDEKNPFASAVKPIQSVQSSWQPSAQTSDASNGVGQDLPQDDKYLISEQKAQIDQQITQRREAEAEAARQAEARRVAEESARARANAAKEAEVAAATKYTNPEKKDEGVWGFFKDIGAGIQQGVGALGDIAIQGGGVIGSFGKNDQELVRHLENVEKVRGWLHGMKDISGNNFVGTRDVEQQAGDIAAGRGDIQDFMAVGGKGLQAGIDATMFMNPARLTAGKVAFAPVGGVSLLAKMAKNPAVRFAARDATFFGALQGTATFQSVYGQTGDLEAAAEAALKDAAIGAAVQGSLDFAGSGINIVANRTVNSLRRPSELAEELVDDASKVTPTPSQERRNVVEENGAPTDGNVSFEKQFEDSELNQSSGLLESAQFTPVLEGLNSAPLADGMANTGVTPQPSQMDSITPVKIETQAPEVTPVSPVADGTVQPSDVVPAADPNMPVIRPEETRELQNAKAGASQAEEALINQRLQEIDPNLPSNTENLPDDMAGAEVPDPTTQGSAVERLMPKLDDNADIKQRIATAAGMGKDVESPVRDILREGGVKDKQAEKIAQLYDDLEIQLREYNTAQEANQKAYAEGGSDALDSEVSRQRSRVTRDMGKTSRRLVRAIDKLEGSRDMKVRLVNSLSSAIGTRNANILTSAGLLERNITQELTANAKLLLKNPVAMTKSVLGNGNILKDTAKSELSHWGDAPNGVVDAMKYVVGNTYRTAMIPTTSLSNTRRGMYRDQLTKWAYKELEGRDLSSAEAHKLAGAAGNELEALVNTFIGVDNGMTNRGQATEALKAWKEYMRTGDSAAKSEFMNRVETHSSLADQMIAGLSKEDGTKLRGLKAVGNLIFPFVRTATNLMKSTVKQDLNPFAKSLLDEIKADQSSGYANAAMLIKSKLVDYGIMSGAAALAGAGVLAYNDGDDVDKPRGWSISIGDDKYIPVRSTAAELPMALAGTAQQIAEDIASGKPRDWQYYAGMVTGSLPYIDQFNQTTGAVDSLTSGEDAGYAAKSYGVNMAKSFVPFTNNSVVPYVDGKQGKSTNVKTNYDEDLFKWLYNSVRSSYDPAFRDSLRDSRDNAGRVRTVDNQGFVSNKKINDPSTVMFNDDIDDLLAYGREAGLGDGVKDMFNTFDNGKDNNFRSVQNAIVFLDTVDGKVDNSKKLEVNSKLGDLAQQIRNGFFGDAGSELLTLNGKNLQSDASVPNKQGSKNSRLPVSMQSIKNAIAQTDLPEEQSTQLFEMSGQKSALYDQLKSKAINYDQYLAAKTKIEQSEASILQNSESYQKLMGLMTELDTTGFFDEGGIGSTKSGQTYLWNSLNSLLGGKGATPAAQYPEDSKGFSPWGDGKRASNKTSDRGELGLKYTPVKSRAMAEVKKGKYTPVSIKVKLGNAVKKDKSQNYSDRSF